MLDSAILIAGVALVFSFLIFVHELGHFLAALLVGVRVEKFMIGFDAWGAGLRKRIRGIEFGVGILPLGGYVKLAGQSDLPGEEETTGADDELSSKGPGARALVFGAGVVMNFLFGFLILVGAQLYGVPKLPAILGHVVEGGPAARSGLEPGDRVVAIDGAPVRWFDEDLMQRIALYGSNPVTLTVERTEGEAVRTLEVRVKPEPGQMRGNLLQIGIAPPASNRIDELSLNPEITDAAGVEQFERLQRELEPGDRIVAVDGRDVPNPEIGGGYVLTYASERPGAEIVLAVERDADETTERFEVPVRVYPVADEPVDIGLRMMYRLASVRGKSPAEAAGLREDDWIGAVDGAGFRSVTEMIEAIQSSALQPLDVTFVRDGETRSARIDPRSMAGDTRLPAGQDTFLGILPATGSEEVIVAEALQGGPADGVLEPGDRIQALNGEPVEPSEPLGPQVARASSRPVTVTVLRHGTEEEVELTARVDPEVGVGRIGIAFAEAAVYRVLEGSRADEAGLSRYDRGVQLHYALDLSTTYLSWVRDGQTMPTVSFPTPAEIVADPAGHGLFGALPFGMDQHLEMYQAASLGAAFTQAADSFWEKFTMMFVLFERLVSGAVEPSAVGGPVMIFQIMYVSAELGFGRLLDIAALISINLAVLNLLPLPVLDGGHLLFLAMEKVMGRKPNARLREIAQYVGFFLLLSLMLMVTFYDIYDTWFKG